MMKIFLFIVSVFLLPACLTGNRKTDLVKVIPQNRQTGVAMVPNERFFKMDISPDTFYISVNSINLKVFNHSDDTASFGSFFSLEYFNQSILLWENALPENLVSDLILRQIIPHDCYDYEISLFDNKRPGKYKVTLDLYTKQKNNLVIGEFYLSEDVKYKDSY